MQWPLRTSLGRAPLHHAGDGWEVGRALCGPKVTELSFSSPGTPGEIPDSQKVGNFWKGPQAQQVSEVSWTKSKTSVRTELRVICCLLHGWGPKCQEMMKKETNFSVCPQKATFFSPPEEGSWALFGWALWRRGAHGHAALAQLSEPGATSTADSHPCRVPCVKGRVKGTSVLQCAVLPTKQLWSGTSSTHPLGWGGGKQPLTRILGNTQVFWAPPACSTSPGAAGTTWHPCPLN